MHETRPIRPRRRISEPDLEAEGWFESDIVFADRDTLHDVALRLEPGWVHVAELISQGVYDVAIYPSHLVVQIGPDLSNSK